MENSDVRRSRHSLTEPSPDVTPVATNDQPSERVIEDGPDYDGLIEQELADLKTGHSVEAQFFDRHEVAQPGEMGEENRTYDETERRRRKYEAFFSHREDSVHVVSFHCRYCDGYYPCSSLQTFW